MDVSSHIDHFPLTQSFAALHAEKYGVTQRIE